MIWQDIILSAGSWIFIIALFPSLLGRDKPPFSTSMLTGLTLAVFAAVYFTLGLWISVASTGILSAAWLVLAGQKRLTRARGLVNMQQARRKQENLRKILEYIDEHGQAGNDDVETFLDVSNATAERYLDELEGQGQLSQVGKTGRNVIYKRK